MACGQVQKDEVWEHWRALAPDRVDDLPTGEIIVPTTPRECSLTGCLALVPGGFSTCSVCFWDLPTEAKDIVFRFIIEWVLVAS
jgi:hypothetical protein